MNALNSALAIGAGGFCGAVLRFWLSALVRKVVPEDWMFTGTMFVNLLGCLLIGGILVFAARQIIFSPLTFQFLLVGVLGSLTTFSTFAAESLELLREGRFGAAAFHIGMNVIVGITLVWTGAMIVEHLLPTDAQSQ